MGNSDSFYDKDEYDRVVASCKAMDISVAAYLKRKKEEKKPTFSWDTLVYRIESRKIGISGALKYDAGLDEAIRVIEEYKKELS